MDCPAWMQRATAICPSPATARPPGPRSRWCMAWHPACHVSNRLLHGGVRMDWDHHADRAQRGWPDESPLSYAQWEAWLNTRLAGALVTALLAALAPSIVVLLYGEPYRPAARLLAALAAVGLVSRRSRTPPRTCWIAISRRCRSACPASSTSAGRAWPAATSTGPRRPPPGSSPIRSRRSRARGSTARATSRAGGRTARSSTWAASTRR